MQATHGFICIMFLHTAGGGGGGDVFGSSSASAFGGGASSGFGGQAPSGFGAQAPRGGSGVGGGGGASDSGVRDIVWSPSMPGVLACSTLGRELQIHGITAFR